MRFVIFAILIVMAVLAAGCAQQEAAPTAVETGEPTVTAPATTAAETIGTAAIKETVAPPTPGAAPEVTQPSPTAGEEWEWVPDGLIGDGEYAQSLPISGSAYTLWWQTVDDTLYMAISVRTTGWVAVGFKPTSGMKDADVVLGWVSDSEVTAQDQFSTGTTGPHLPDTQLGGSDDIITSGGAEAGGVTVIEFSRLLVTGDMYDATLSVGETVPFIWSYSQSDNPTVYHTSRGSGSFTV